MALLFVLACFVTLGGVLAGCGSSSSASGGGAIGTVPGGGTGEAGTTGELYALGRVIAPDSTPVAGAVVRTDPPLTVVETDSQGYFRIREPLPEAKYTFIAEARDGDIGGKTEVSAPTQNLTGKQVWIILGREASLDEISIDSVRANPVGPGLNRTGNR